MSFKTPSSFKMQTYPVNSEGYRPPDSLARVPPLKLSSLPLAGGRRFAKLEPSHEQRYGACVMCGQ